MLKAAVSAPETPEGEAPGHDELERLSHGWGAAASEALDWSRGEW
jgi:hypothetical protein